MTDRPFQISVDRQSPVPLYFQVAAQLEQAIESGALERGYRLTNEIAMADQLGLSRPTMRRAIQELVSKGLLVRKRGVGTQVVQGGVRREVGLTSLYDDLASTGQRPQTRVLRNEVTEAPGSVAAELGIAPGSPVVQLVRVRLASGEPLAILCNWLPEWVVSATDDELEARGLYQIVRANGTHLRVARQRIGAREATAWEADHLGVGEGAPLLTMSRTSWDDQGKVVEFGDHVYRSETYSFTVTLVER